MIALAIFAKFQKANPSLLSKKYVYSNSLMWAMSIEATFLLET